jgi:hypothetical protein
MGGRRALDVALDIFHRPMTVRDYVNTPLPADVLAVIRIAAGGDIEIGRLNAENDSRARDIRDACVFYVQQILFHPRADAYRMLGLTSAALPKQVQDHKRLLLKWLHPDRNPNKWEQALFQRVIKAAIEIEHAGPVVEGQEHFQSRPRSSDHKKRRTKHVMALERIPLKRHWRARVYRYLKRGLLVIGSSFLLVATWLKINEQNPLEAESWQNLIAVWWRTW